MSERDGADGAIGRILVEQLKEIFGHWKKFKNSELTRVELQEKEHFVPSLLPGNSRTEVSLNGAQNLANKL